MAKRLLPMVGNNTTAAYSAAMNAVKQTYGVDQITGRVVKKPFATNLIKGDIDNGQWAHDIITNDLPKFNDGNMPDEYTYYPAANFNMKTNPLYVVSWLTKEGEYRAAGVFLVFEESEQGKKAAAEQKEKARDDRRAANFAKKKALAAVDQKYKDGLPGDVRWKIGWDNIMEAPSKTGASILNYYGKLWDKGNSKKLIEKYGPNGYIYAPRDE